MAWMKSPLHLAILSVGLSLPFGLFASFLTPAAGAAPSPKISRPPIVSLTFEPPPDEGAPAGTGGAASRGGCLRTPKGSPLLSPLIPAKKPVLTVAARPTFFVYLPQTAAKTAQWLVIDKNNNEVYQTTVEIASPGIVSFTLPDTAPALEISKDYQWYFSVICNPTDSSSNLTIRGSVRRTELSMSLMETLDKATPLERAVLYAKNGIWQDTLTILAELRRLHPNDSKLIAEWEELLKSAGLEALAKKPLIKAQ